MSHFIAVITAVIGAIALFVFFSFLLSWPVMMLWNGCLVDALTIAKPIGWLQAWGLSILAAFFFKSTSTSSSK